MTPRRVAPLTYLAVAVALALGLGACTPSDTTAAPAVSALASPSTVTVSILPSPTASATDPAPADDFPFHPNVFAAESVGANGFMSWAYLDRATGAITGSTNSDQLVDTHSMIKAWLAADFLRRETEQGRTPSTSDLNRLTDMIEESNNEDANYFFWSVLGGKDSIDRLIATCGLTDSIGTDADWARTQVSARDTVRMGACIGDGRAAGPQYTDYLLGLMRDVRDDGDFGIRDAFPADVRSTIAIKNGWYYEEGLYRVDCMAIGDTWVLAVLQRNPSYNLDTVGGVCTAVTQALLADPDDA